MRKRAKAANMSTASSQPSSLHNTESRTSLSKYSSKIHRADSFKHRRNSAPILVNPYGDGAGLNFDDDQSDEEEEQELLRQSREPLTWKYLLVTCTVCLAWMIASGGNVSLINWLLKKEGFHYPITGMVGLIPFIHVRFCPETTAKRGLYIL